MKRILCFVLCAALMLPLLPKAFAADTSGLSAFTDSKKYSSGTFADVSDSAWYAASVQTVYEKAIMDGTGSGKFDPDGTVSWSQAVTIAARLHAAYHGKDIAAADGPWYAQYLAYARDNGLLPGLCPSDADTDSTPITREGLAVLFRSVLDEKDLLAVNDQSIPDLNKVREEYRDAVSEMFASGIFTGKDGLFDPDGKATRAEVSTIVARLLCPGQRVSRDARQNPYMVDQMGNLYNGGLCARLGDTVYYLCNAPYQDGEESISTDWLIIARTDSGQTRQVYASSGEGLRTLSYLSISPDGQLCFVQRDQANKRDILKQLDLETGVVKDLYTTPSSKNIGFYLFYDNELYLYEEYGSTDQIGRVANGKMTTLVTMPHEWVSLYVADTMYCFGGKLCWLQLAPRDSKGDDHLMILDLETGKTSSIVTEADDFAYQGATVWSAEFTNGDYPIVLKRRSLLMPELTESVRTMDGEFAHYAYNLYANGSQLYYQGREAQKLCAISPSGDLTVAATARTPYFEASAVTSQGTALMLNNLLSSYDFQSVDIVLPDGERTNLYAYLNQPYQLTGTGLLEAAPDIQVKTSWKNSDEGQSDFYSDALRAFLTDDGALVLEVQVTNQRSQKLNLGYIRVKLSGAVEGEACFSFAQDPSTIQSSQTYTLVFPKGTVDVKGDLEDLDLNIRLFGRWED